MFCVVWPDPCPPPRKVANSGQSSSVHEGSVQDNILIGCKTNLLLQVILTAEELQELVQTVNLEATTADHTKDIVRKIRERMASAAAPNQ